MNRQPKPRYKTTTAKDATTAPRGGSAADMKCIELPEYIVFAAGDFPVVCGDLADALDYARKESAKELNAGREYRVFNMTTGRFTCTYKDGTSDN